MKRLALCELEEVEKEVERANDMSESKQEYEEAGSRAGQNVFAGGLVFAGSGCEWKSAQLQTSEA